MSDECEPLDGPRSLSAWTRALAASSAANSAVSSATNRAVRGPGAAPCTSPVMHAVLGPYYQDRHRTPGPGRRWHACRLARWPQLDGGKEPSGCVQSLQAMLQGGTE